MLSTEKIQNHFLSGAEPISTALSKTKQALSTSIEPDDPNYPSLRPTITKEDVCPGNSGYFQSVHMQNLELVLSNYEVLSPEFVKEFYQSYVTDTMIDNIKTEYITYIEGGRTQVAGLINNEEVTESTSGLSSSLDSIQTKFSDIGSLLESASNSITKNVVNIFYFNFFE